MGRIALRFLTALFLVGAVVAVGLVIVGPFSGRSPQSLQASLVDATSRRAGSNVSLTPLSERPTVVPELRVENVPFPQFRKRRSGPVGAPTAAVATHPSSDAALTERERTVNDLVALDALARAEQTATARATPLWEAEVKEMPPGEAAMAALRELDETHGDGNDGDVDSSRIFGVRVRQPVAAAAAAPTSPTATPVPLVDPLLQRVAGQARGFVLLPLMHPRARASIEAQIDTMLRAQLQELYISVLVDDTFGTDFTYLNEIVQRLNAGGRSLTFVVYLTNGPTMRRYDTTTIETAFSWINPIDFRDLIQHDRGIRDRFQRIVRAAAPVWEANARLNPLNRNIGIVMLEDNLDRRSYEVMRSLARTVAPPTVEFMRNPCPGCFEGNDGDAAGDSLELHAPAAPEKLKEGDGYTLDGAGYGYPDARAEGEWEVDRVRAALDASLAKGARFFGLWRASRQGNYSRQFAHPDERNYEVPTAAQIETDIELLRHGLKAVE